MTPAKELLQVNSSVYCVCTCTCGSTRWGCPGNEQTPELHLVPLPRLPDTYSSRSMATKPPCSLFHRNFDEFRSRLHVVRHWLVKNLSLALVA
jgi:hypothetical protein